MNTHTGHRLFSIRTIAVAITIAVFGAMVPQTADAQRASIGGIDAKLDEVLQGLCLLPSAPETCFTTRIVFVTSTVHTGDFGGVSGGDAICNGHAQAAHLPGVYRAWLSGRAGFPDTRFTHSADPYVRPDDVTIANDWADLVDGGLLHNIVRDERGEPSRFSALVWTGTAGTGLAATPENHCLDWTSNASSEFGTTGHDAALSVSWTKRTNPSSCDTPSHLYCFQQ